MKLTEIIIVLLLLAILAGVGTFAALRFIESGRQVNRENVARTVYLAAQNRLTELRVTGRLDSFVQGIDKDANVYTLTRPEDWSDIDNEDNIYYISLPGDSAVLELLEQALPYGEVLDGAVLIEFNIRTGVVLSVFYSDRLGGGGFKYGGEDSDNNIIGRRGGYEHARRRSQGYYGVGKTGRLPEEINPLIISIYDSFEDEFSPPGYSSENLLFAMAVIPTEYRDDELLFSLSGVEIADDENIFIHNPNDIDDTFLMFWILDHVEGDTTGPPNSRIERFGLPSDAVITVGIKNLDTGSGAVSFENRPFFGRGSFGGDNVIRTARHLFNIRHAPGEFFTLWRAPDLSDVTNFAPIPDLCGMFSGGGHTIENLAINVSTPNAGLFGQTMENSVINGLTLLNPAVTGGDNSGAAVGLAEGSVSGVLIENPSVRGGTNVGGAVGRLDGSLNDVYIRYNEFRLIEGAANVGGAVGLNGTHGEIRDVVFISTESETHVAGAVAGGIIGRCSSADLTSLERLMLLALAPRTPGDDEIRPIAGIYDGARPNSQTLVYLYGESLRPESPALYNVNPANMGFGRSTLGIRNMLWEDGNFGVLDEDAVSLSNIVYPYNFLPQWEDFLRVPEGAYTTADLTWLWPITIPSVPSVSALFYFERYSDGSYGVRGPAEIGLAGLRNDVPITNAGFMYMLDLALFNSYAPERLERLHMFIRRDENAGRAEAVPMVFENGADISTAFSGFMVFTLPNAILLEVMASSNVDLRVPLEIGFGEVPGPDIMPPAQAAYSLHPFFAHHIIPHGQPDGSEFFVRTPRQMQNINEMPTGGNGLVFRQTRNIDFLNDGDIQPNNLTSAGTIGRAVITGEFRGRYIGGFNRIDNVAVNGSSNAGLFAENYGQIEEVILRNSSIAGSSGVGGLAGQNNGQITRSGVEYSTVSGANIVGGVAGQNSGLVSDVYFLSVADVSEPPVSANGSVVGGIVGRNNTVDVTRAFFLAPAPSDGNMIFPIIGAGHPALTNGENETTFFLQGHRHSVGVDASGNRVWLNRPYNLGATAGHGFGAGLITNFTELEWLRFTFNVPLELYWRQPPAGFPYPVLRGMTEPAEWPLADSPALPG